IAMVRTRTSSAAARMPGARSGTSTWRKTRNVLAPKTRAAASSRGSICSMYGVITRTTNGTVGTRLATMTPFIVPASRAWLEHGGERDAVGYRRDEERQQEEQQHRLLPGEVAAGERVGGGNADHDRERHDDEDDLHCDEEH